MSFLAAAALGLAGCGLALAWASGPAAVDPTADPVVAALHIGVLATLSMGVLVALRYLARLSRIGRCDRHAWRA